jgi:TRAP-type C4-dicarboxylate transport system substrate-binding protein
MITRRNFVAGAAAGAAMLPLARPALSQNVLEIRVAHVNQTTFQGHAPMVAATEKITARTNGRLVFRIFPGAQLGTTTEMVEQASQGEPIITYTDAAYMASFGVPELSILGGPFLIDNIDQGFKLHDSELVAGWYDRLAEGAGIRVLALNWFGGARHVVGKAAYPEPSDLKGVKIRVPPVETWRKTFEPLGAIPTTVEAAETYSALSQGVVDAAESPILSLESNLWTEAAPHITLTSHFELFTGWAMSGAVFDGLSDEEKAIVTEEFRNAGVESSRDAASKIAAARGRMEAKGITFTEANIPAYREATASFYTSFPQWPAGLFDAVRAAATA